MGKDSSSTEKASNTKTPDVDFRGAAILNEDGSETPITEEMVQDVCRKLGSETDAESKKVPIDESPGEAESQRQ